MKIFQSSLTSLSLRLNRVPRLKRFLKRTYACTGFAAGRILLSKRPSMVIPTCLTPGEHHCFFGYYDKSPWNASEEFIIYLRVPFADRMPGTTDTAEIRLLNSQTGRTETIARTSAWNWQQGCMLQWYGGEPSNCIIHNDFRDNHCISVVRDRSGRKIKEYRAPVYCLKADGTRALLVNFSRLNHGSPAYGYPVLIGNHSEPCPDDDGIWSLDLETGAIKLLLSLHQICHAFPRLDYKNCYHYFNHVTYNPSGNRFAFFHRWKNQLGEERTTMYTANSDGTGIFNLVDNGMTSHYSWKSDRQILAWANHKRYGLHYYLFTDQSRKSEIIGDGVLDEDGHPSFSPDGRFILTDTYADWTRQRTLILYDTQTQKRFDIASFHAPLVFEGLLRCDLHPRFDRRGMRVCVDSAHEGVRRLYMLNLGDLMDIMNDYA